LRKSIALVASGRLPDNSCGAPASFCAFKHVGAGDRDTLKIELISDEALKTSEIEGEILNRDSVQSSLHFWSPKQRAIILLALA
jgi:Domain of unknown function (DUF4172)